MGHLTHLGIKSPSTDGVGSLVSIRVGHKYRHTLCPFGKG